MKKVCECKKIKKQAAPLSDEQSDGVIARLLDLAVSEGRCGDAAALRELQQRRAQPQPHGVTKAQVDLPEDAARILRENLWNLYGDEGKAEAAPAVEPYVEAGSESEFHKSVIDTLRAELAQARAEATALKKKGDCIYCNGTGIRVKNDRRTNLGDIEAIQRRKEASKKP